MTIDHAQEVSRALHQLVEVEGLPKIQAISLDRGRTGGAMQMSPERLDPLEEWARSDRGTLCGDPPQEVLDAHFTWMNSLLSAESAA